MTSVLLFRKINYVEIVEDGPGSWSGRCAGIRIEGPITPRLIADQVVIHLSGGIGEALYRGERRASAVLRFAEAWCGCETDLRRARTLMTDHGLDEGQLVERTMALLLENWKSVELVASGLIQNRRVEGDQLMRWISYAV